MNEANLPRDEQRYAVRQKVRTIDLPKVEVGVEIQEIEEIEEIEDLDSV
jgi:hypothetical protein